MDPMAILERAVSWVREHPEEILRAARNAAGLRVTVPLDLLRFGVEQIKSRKAPTDVEILAAPPGVRIGATVNAMKTTMRVGATLAIEYVRLSPEQLRLELRLHDVALAVVGESDSPVAALIKSGALDLSKPGKLLKHLPKRPPFIVEADGDRIVLDLMQDPKISRKVGKVTSRLLPFLTITGVESSGDHLAIQLACLPDGLGGALGTLRGV